MEDQGFGESFIGNLRTRDLRDQHEFSEMKKTYHLSIIDYL